MRTASAPASSSMPSSSAPCARCAARSCSLSSTVPPRGGSRAGLGRQAPLLEPGAHLGDLRALHGENVVDHDVNAVRLAAALELSLLLCACHVECTLVVVNHPLQPESFKLRAGGAGQRGHLRLR